jgi:hypothetical protein
VKDQVPSVDIPTVVSSVQETMDLETLSSKLLSWILAKNPINGPETIGVLDAISPKSAPSNRQDTRRPFRSQGRGRGDGYQGRGRSDGFGSQHKGRMERSQPDSFGAYPKKKFVHPSEPKKARKKY